MRLKSWHAGKLIILWSWGSFAVALALTAFFATPVDSSPVAHLVTLLIPLIILVGLSAITWIWLGDRKAK